jgi:hypothetical protein
MRTIMKVIYIMCIAINLLNAIEFFISHQIRAGCGWLFAAIWLLVFTITEWDNRKIATKRAGDENAQEICDKKY